MRGSDNTNNPSIISKSHDKQIYDTKHDEIMMWCYELFKKKDFVKKIIPQWMLSVFESHSVKIEESIYRYGSNTCLGFADLYIKIKLGPTEKADPLIVENKYYFNEFEIYIEVKTTVNVGETIRQINYYKSGIDHRKSMWYVVAPPFSKSGVLREQGIGFIAYNPLGEASPNV